MYRILALTTLDLDRPIRGTPLRALHFIEQMKKRDKIFLCAPTPISDDDIIWTPLVQDSRVRRFFQLRKFIRSHQIDCVWMPAHSMMKLPVMLKFTTGVKILIDLHGWPSEETAFYNKISAWKKFWWDFSEKFLLMFYDRIFVVSEKYKTRFPLLQKKMLVVHGGVNEEDFCEPAPRQEGGALRIGYAGNPQSYQGLPALFDAAETILKEKIFPFQLLLILSGETTEAEKILKEKGLEACTTIKCNVPHGEVRDYLRACDALVVPRPSINMTEYAFPSKVPEFLATGVPVIVSDVGPVREFLDDHSAVIIPSDELPGSLVQALKKIYSMRLEERRALGRRGQTLAKSRLLWDKLGETIRGGFTAACRRPR